MTEKEHDGCGWNNAPLGESESDQNETDEGPGSGESEIGEGGVFLSEVARESRGEDSEEGGAGGDEAEEVGGDVDEAKVFAVDGGEVSNDAIDEEPSSDDEDGSFGGQSPFGGGEGLFEEGKKIGIFWFVMAFLKAEREEKGGDGLEKAEGDGEAVSDVLGDADFSGVI